MYRPRQTRSALLILAGCLAVGSAAQAAPPPASIHSPTDIETSGTNGAGDHYIGSNPGSQTVGDWRPVGLSHLERLRGGDGSESNVLIDGLVDGNTADNINSGDNLLGGSAFGHASGINTVIQNSGSNVLIQSGTAVNVQFTSPTP